MLAEGEEFEPAVQFYNGISSRIRRFYRIRFIDPYADQVPRRPQRKSRTWEDINFNRGVVTVRYKAEYGFSPKSYKGREIPIPNQLVRALKTWKDKSATECNLLFPTSGCRPKLNFLDECKAIAKRAKLSSSDFWLHKFRATFATWHLWAGVDLRTVQQWMGHTDMESTMRYLKPNRSESVREKVELTFS